MDAVLVINHFLKGEKFDELHSHLVRVAQSEGISLAVKTNSELACQPVCGDFVLFWDKDTSLARRIEKSGIPVFNSAASIEKCDDKARTYIELDGIVRQPKTLIAPKCYYKADMSEFVCEAADILGLPLVFKECFGSFGKQVFLCESVDEIKAHISEKPFLLQQFVYQSAGRDKRLEIVGGKCVCAAERENKNDFRSNVTNGGVMTPCEPTKKELEAAIAACEALGLTFGGVDILDDGSVCEVNSNAHIINIMNATGIDIAPMIFRTIKEKIKR